MARREFRAVKLLDHPRSLDHLSPSDARDPRERDTYKVVWYHCYLDNVLEALLRRAFIRDRAVDELFEPQKPLWSLTSKVGVAYAIGLITREQRADLLLVNRIRNRVAHNIRSASFRSSDVRNLARQLTHAKEISGSSNRDEQREWAALPAREQFAYAVWFLGLRLERQWRVTRLARPRAVRSQRSWKWPRVSRR